MERNFENGGCFCFQKKQKRRKYPKDLKTLNSRIIEISSTEIRNKIKKGEPVDFLIPKEILNYIRKHNLYKT